MRQSSAKSNGVTILMGGAVCSTQLTRLVSSGSVTHQMEAEMDSPALRRPVFQGKKSRAISRNAWFKPVQLMEWQFKKLAVMIRKQYFVSFYFFAFCPEAEMLREQERQSRQLLS